MTLLVNNKYSDEQIFEISKDARIELVKRFAKKKNILEWGKYLFPEKFSLPFCNDLHRYFCDIRDYELTNTEAPRNHAKTTIRCFLIPIFQALEEPKNYIHYLNVQSTYSKAISVNSSIKQEIEHNKYIRIIYGDQIGDKWTDQQFVLKNEVVFTAISAEQSIRGLNYRNKRPDCIIIDDLYDETDIHNLKSTEKKNAWFWSSLYPARARTRKCCIHIQGTAINHQDLLEDLKKKDRWKSRTFKAIKNFDSKLVLWKELNNFDDLLKDKEEMGSVIFSRELQNERWDQEDSYIKRSWIKYYDPKDLKFDKNFHVSDIVLLCDPSIGKNNESDFTGMVLMIEAQWNDSNGKQYYIENIWNERISLNERVNLLQKIYDNRPKDMMINRIKIESISGFADFVQEVKRRTNLPVREINRVKDKISVLESKSHFFENGKIFINKNISQKLLDEFVYQLTTNYPRHDDMRDALMLGLENSKYSFDWI